jgi:mono/diheme cytochrome c family protein
MNGFRGLFVLLFAACGGGSPVPAALSDETIAGAVAIARVGCVQCHDAEPVAAARFTPAVAPPLATATTWFRGPARTWLRGHYGGDDATQLWAWLDTLDADAQPPAERVVPAGTLQRGERLVDELACRACHAPAQLDLADRPIEHARMAAFLRQPATRRPGLAHVPLTDAEADAIAAWLLRSRSRIDDRGPGFAYECFEVHIASALPPDLTGLVPTAAGLVDRVSADPATREHHVALRFAATLRVPADGEWTFTLGSDDGSWLWIDDTLVVANPGLLPHHEKGGAVRLSAGDHALRVLYSQAAGGRSLELRWQGPGVPEQVIDASVARAERVVIDAPPAPPPPEAAAVTAGREAARQRRCDACHGIDEPQFLALPAPAPAPAFAQLGARACVHHPGAASLLPAARAAVLRPWTPAEELQAALLRDGCLSCHARGGRGGLAPPVRARLAEREDLGDEGRLPPDLTGVGRRLRPEWLRRVVAEGHAVRPYLSVRMPAFGDESARRYAEWFAAVDAPDVVDVEPAHDEAAVALGRSLTGTGGRNCISCHPVAGHKAIGPQGMDLTIQHERLRPAYLRDWLLRPQELRPGTRMPTAWFRGDEHDQREVDAVRAWFALGKVAPLPPGTPRAGDTLVLDPRDRPVLHGAFLRGLSARGLAVGTPERTHFAWDLGALRLAWLWRGAFLDAKGTWSGRAGQLLEPLGDDHVVLRDFTVGDGADRRLLGQRRTPDGLPIVRIGVGEAVYEDTCRPRLVAGGSEVVRTLRVEAGRLTFVWSGAQPGVNVLVGGQAADRHDVAAGEVLEVVYRW